MVDLTGKTFGRLEVLRRSLNNKWGAPRWLCICDCGNSKTTEGSSLRNESTKSCGCLKSEGNNTIHGHDRKNKRTQVYRAWCGMMTRCYDINHAKYPQWGGRGIKVCERWKIFGHFLQDMGDPPTKALSLDRANNSLGYYKSNCRWATSKEQSRNRRNNRFISHRNKTQCLSAWAEEYGIKASVISDRINRGWSIKKALTEPVRR